MTGTIQELKSILGLHPDATELQILSKLRAAGAMTHALGVLILHREKSDITLKTALGYHLNADAYASTFPDNPIDERYLNKSETWNRLQARVIISPELAAECSRLMKQHATETNHREKMNGLI